MFDVLDEGMVLSRRIQLCCQPLDTIKVSGKSA